MFAWSNPPPGLGIGIGLSCSALASCAQENKNKTNLTLQTTTSITTKHLFLKLKLSNRNMTFDGPGKVAQHFRTFSALEDDLRFGSQNSHGGLQLPISPGPGRSNTLF